MSMGLGSGGPPAVRRPMLLRGAGLCLAYPETLGFGAGAPYFLLAPLPLLMPVGRGM